MTSQDYKQDLLKIDIPVVDAKKAKKDKKKKEEKNDEEALSVAADLNPNNDEPVKPEESSDKKNKQESSSSSQSSSESSSSDDDSDLCTSERDHRRIKRRDAKLAKLTYHQVKHVFSIDIKQIKNIPVLSKFIREAKDLQLATMQTQRKEEDVDEDDQDFVSSSYIQNVAVKYSFPLDEDEILESDYIKKVEDAPASQSANFDYNVSMNTVHTYLMPKEDKISDLLQTNKQLATSNAQSTNLFNLSVALYQDNREFIIGNAQLPMEDLADLVLDHD